MKLNSFTLTLITNPSPTLPDTASRLAEEGSGGALALASRAAGIQRGSVFTGLKTAGRVVENFATNTEKGDSLVQAANLRGGSLLDPGTRLDVASMADYRSRKPSINELTQADQRYEQAMREVRQNAALADAINDAAIEDDMAQERAYDEAATREAVKADIQAAERSQQLSDEAAADAAAANAAAATNAATASVNYEA